MKIPSYFLSRKKRAFTLIELLVVIVIIGILTSIGVSTFESYKSKARDAQRIRDLNDMKRSLDLYVIDKGSLPRPTEYGEATSSPGMWDNWWDSSAEDLDGDGLFFLDFLSDNDLKAVVDPINSAATSGSDVNNFSTEGYRYLYFHKVAGYVCTGGCGMADNATPECRDNAYYMLMARLEGTQNGSDLDNNSILNDEYGCECLIEANTNVNDQLYRICGRANI